MKQNITLSIEKDLIKKARILAAQRQLSVSRMLSEELRRLVEDSETYEAARQCALSFINTGLHLGGKISVAREALHER